MRDTMLKAAALCREAADKLREAHSPEKMAGELADLMVSKGLLQKGEKERYASIFANDSGDKIAALSEGLGSLPTRSGSLGEPAIMQKSASGTDAWDNFFGDR